MNEEILINAFGIIIISLLITVIGFGNLAISKSVLLNNSGKAILALSWLTGCVLISFSSLINFLLGFTGINGGLILILLLPVISIAIFTKRIKANQREWRNSLKAKPAEKQFNNPLEKYISLTVIVTIALLVIFIFILNAVKPAWAWDSWMIWSFKAKMFYLNIVNLDLINHPGYAYAHWDYPLLVPFMQAVYATFLSIFDERYNQVFFSITYLGFVLLTIDFIQRYIKGTLSYLLVIPFVTFPILILNMIGGYADGVLTTYNFVIVYYLYIYLSKNEDWALIPAAMGIAGSLMSKNEGSMFILILFVISVLYLKLFTSHPFAQYKKLAISFLSGFLVNLPWLFFIKIYGISNDIISSENIITHDWTGVSVRIYKIIDFMFSNNLFRFENWGLLFYICFIFIALGLIKRYYKESFFFAGALILNLAGLMVIYFISPHDIDAHMGSSVERVTLTFTPLVMCYLVILLHNLQPDSITESKESK